MRRSAGCNSPCCLGAMTHSREQQVHECARARLHASDSDEKEGVMREAEVQDEQAPATRRRSSLGSNFGQV